MCSKQMYKEEGKVVHFKPKEALVMNAVAQEWITPAVIEKPQQNPLFCKVLSSVK